MVLLKPVEKPLDAVALPVAVSVKWVSLGLEESHSAEWPGCYRLW